ncbi:trihelix transcription factor GTL1-like [Hordeum vulgare]|nr:trihelix transcription factor GTL1-like [Hordeum vulgare]
MQQPPDMPPFSPAGWRGPAGAPSPISSRPPAPTPAPAPGQQHQHQHQQHQMDEQHGAAVSGSGSGSVDGGEEGERGGSSSAAPGGNRWPRQETLALLKIRSEMDAAFREAALKGPLWEEVSRRLAEMGHTRSAKKCREKFENVDKYYRRTKDGRTGRGDGKTYRFFTELEALHGAHQPPPAAPVSAPAATIVTYSAVPTAPPRVLQAAEPSPPPLFLTHQPVPTESPACLTTTAPVGDASFSDSDGEDTDETADGGKRKRRGGSWGHGGKAMRFFEGLMRQVMERQEAMQSRLLEAIERRDQDRMIREEAWRRQEVARLAREQDALAQERAVAASRDAAVVSFIQRITGQIVPVQAPSSFPAKPAATATSVKPPPLQPTPVASAAPAPAPPTPRPPVQAQPNVTTPMRTQPQTPQPQQHVTPTATPEPQPQTPQQQPHHQQSKEIVVHAPEQTPVDMAGGASPSRWPKAEVHALIQLRTEMEARYQDTAPKGPLWEDISVGMRRLGYNRSSKRCKEKWENINKYFKKVKESSRKRPEDSKTCPYFHQLDALYRTKALAVGSSSSSSSGVHAPALQAPAASSARAEPAAVTVLAPVPLSSQTPSPAAQHVEHAAKNLISNGNGHGNGAAMQVKASNGAPPTVAMFPSSAQAAGNGANSGTATNKLELKQEGVAKETAPVVQPAVAMNHSYGRNDRRDVYDLDSDSMDEDDEDDFDDDDDEEDDDVPGGRNINMPPVLHQYDAHFLQRQHQHQQQQQNHNHNHNHNVVRPNAANGSGNPPAGNATPTSAAGATNGAPFLAMVQ